MEIKILFVGMTGIKWKFYLCLQWPQDLFELLCPMEIGRISRGESLMARAA